MDYLFYGFMWAFFWEWFTLQQGKPNDDISAPGQCLAAVKLLSLIHI